MVAKRLVKEGTAGARSRVRESLVTRIWIDGWFRKDGLFTACGRRLRVIHPGRQSSDCGPDICDAVIAFKNGRPIRGDIEIHVDSGEWKAHGHHKDPNFNRVILHVVLYQHGSPWSITADNRKVPILSLSRFLKRPLEHLCHQAEESLRRGRPCRVASRKGDSAFILAILQTAGEERFLLKAGQFKASLADGHPNQVLYEGIMKALGYSKNEIPFGRLARLLPVQGLQDLALNGEAFAIQAMVLGTAGLLPVTERETAEAFFSPPDIRELGRLRSRWVRWETTQSMCRKDWRFFRVRPGNLPPRRIAGISHLLVRFSGDLSRNVLELATAPSLRQAQKALGEGFVVRTSDYWAGHGDFGVEIPHCGAVIGPARAADITVNVILPFLLAYSDIYAQPRLRRRTWNLYRTHRKLQENRITRYMLGQIYGEKSCRVESACQQQGLIHLYRQFCAGGKCGVCPLARAHSPGHGQTAGAGYLLDTEVAQ